MVRNPLPFVIEPMERGHVPQVSALERRVFTHPWSEHAFHYEVTHNPMAHFYVLRQATTANAGGEAQAAGLLSRLLRQTSSSPILGYGGFWLVIDEAHICTLAVDPDYRGQGAGELLLLHMVEQAVVLDAAVATLEVRVSNRVAQQLYRKYSFSAAGLRKGYYQDNHEDALIMTTGILNSVAFQAQLDANRTRLRHRLSAEPKLTLGAPDE